jgi:redox-sensitive bicupin YhaK (pirin superfamily)
VVSNLEARPRETPCGGRAAVAVEPVRDLHHGHAVALGGPRALTVTRTLPNRDRRMVGAWCFADSFGPDRIGPGEPAGMQVPPHPHIGLQTVSWLVAGEVVHRDSLGSEQLITPGGLNLMTAGLGIAHSERSVTRRSPVLHGVQLWTALPDRHRQVEPHFEHHSTLPVLTDGGLTLTVLMGEIGGHAAPARIYSPLLGAEATMAAGASARLPLDPDWEYAVLALAGTSRVDDVPLRPGPLLYLGRGRRELAIDADGPARLLLLGGEPFDENIVMWWNFVGRDHDDIVAARADWTSGSARFPAVPGDPDDRLPAPPMPTVRLRPRGPRR